MSEISTGLSDRGPRAGLLGPGGGPAGQAGAVQASAFFMTFVRSSERKFGRQQVSIAQDGPGLLALVARRPLLLKRRQTLQSVLRWNHLEDTTVTTEHRIFEHY